MARGSHNGRPERSDLPVDKLDDQQLMELMRAAENELLRRLDPEKVFAGTGIKHESTVDLAVAAYLHYKGVPILGVQRRGNGNGGRHQGFRFTFGCSVQVAERLRMEFLNSDMVRFFNEARGSRSWNGG